MTKTIKHFRLKIRLNQKCLPKLTLVWCVCMCVRERESHHRVVCVCVWERERERERETSHHSMSAAYHGLFAITYKHHHCVCHATLFLSRAWTDGKTNNIINFLYFNFESWSSRLWKGELAVFGQSQCTVPVGQSEQTALVGRRDFVENEAFERGGA